MKIKHVLADGTVLDSLDGYQVRPESAPELYEVLRRLNHENIKKQDPSNDSDN